MKLLTFFEMLKSRGIKLHLDAKGNLRVVGRHDRLDPALLAEMKDNKAGIIQWLKDARRTARPDIAAVARVSAYVPTSFAQQRLWFIDRLGGGSTQYNMPGAWRIQGPFDEATAERALTRIIERHEPLRTVFVDGESGPQQWIRPSFTFHLTRIDHRTLAPEEREAAVIAALDADVLHPFDLSTDLMLRATFIRASDNEGVLLVNMHHIASDGWSMGVLMNEFVQLYEAFMHGRPDPLRPLAIQYADYAQWQRQWLEGAVLEEQLSYWEHQLAELPVVHGLPLDHPRPLQQGFQGAIHWAVLDAVSLAGLKQLALSSQTTLFMVLHAVFALLLTRHGNSTDIVIGTPVANRLQKELEPLVGFFVNTLVLRTQSVAEQTFREYLAAVKQVHLDAQAHQDLPFEYLVERLRPARSTSHTALFQIMLSMNTTENSVVPLPGLTLIPLSSERITAKFDLTLEVQERADGLVWSFVYNPELFEAVTIERLSEHLIALLRGVVATPEATLHTLPLLSADEQHHLVHTLNATQVDYPQDTCLHELFEAQVARHPDAVALVYEDITLTYDALNKRANRLAHYLRAQGVGPDVLVGLCVERSIAMMVGILGILKAGGAYVPLDPGYPADRLAYVLQDSAPAMLLTQTQVEACLPVTSIPVLRLDTEMPSLQAYATENLSPSTIGLTAAHLAYVLYTSGSTGQPKGVMVEHRGVSNYLAHAVTSYLPAMAGTVLSSPLCFDATLTTLLPPLLVGKPVLMLPDDETTLSQLSERLFAEGEGWLFKITPAHLEALAYLERSTQVGTAAHRIVIGGEQLAAATLRQWKGAYLPQATFINEYGPTETVVGCSVWALAEAADLVVLDRAVAAPIGHPIGNTQLYVLGAQQQLQPMHSVGELYIGGAGVARGYLNQPMLTQERFIASPYAPNERLYKTGDLVRYRGDGELEFIGRIDDQVKIRGFRIELGEIEGQLRQLGTVREAVVMAREDGPGQKRLVAYVVPSDDVSGDVSRYREGLAAVLPDYMVPAAFVVLDALPLTSNGKVDKKALPAPEGLEQIGEYVEPRTATEWTLQRVWQEALSVSTLSATANFFEAGGHSILAMYLISIIRKNMGVALELQDVFKMQTVREMAAYIDAKGHLGTIGESIYQNNLLRLRKGDPQSSSLFIIHPIGGYVHCYTDLSMEMSHLGSIYGLQVEGSAPATIPEMAGRYISTIKDVQPHGPYLIGGWSMGGIIAYEMAQQIGRLGDSVDFIFMIDSFLPGVNPADDAGVPITDERLLLRALASDLGIFYEEWIQAERSRLESMTIDDFFEVFLELGKKQGRLPVDFTLADLKSRFAVIQRNALALSTYRALPLDKEIHLIRAKETRSENESLGWDSVASKVTITECGGDHFSIMRRPHVAALAGVVSKSMYKHILQMKTTSPIGELV